MISKRTRTIKFYDLHATVTLSEGRAGIGMPDGSVDLWSILTAGQRLVSDGSFRMAVDDKHAEVRVQDAKPARTIDGRDAIVILIAKADKSTADQAVYNIEARSHRIDRKGPTEGADFSAHLVVIRPPLPNRHPAVLIEDTAGVPTGTVLHVLNQIVKALEKNTPDLFRVANTWGVRDLDDSPTRYRSTVAISFSGHLSKDVQENLNAVHAVTLVRCAQKGELDELPEPFEKGDYVLHLKVSRRGPRAGRYGPGFLQKVCAWGKRRDFDQLQVRFTDRNKSDHTLKLDTDDATVLNQDDFVRRGSVDLGDDEQPTSVLQIREKGQLLSHMLRLGASCFTDSSQLSDTSR